MIIDVCRNCKANFVYLEETKICTPNNTFLDTLNNNRHIKFVIRNASGGALGILTRIKSWTFEVLDSLVGTYCATVIV